MEIDQKKCEEIIKDATEIGIARITSGEVKYSESSKENEEFCVLILKEAAMSQGVDPERIIHHGGHTFPDVSIAGTKIGIELKGSRSGHAFLGNSVIASTMLPGLEKIYVLYWIDDKKIIGCRDYFECVSGAQVTHSPRFVLDIDADLTECIFGNTPDKVGTISDVCFGKSGINHKKIIGWMRDQAIANGRDWWWINESSDVDVEVSGTLSIRRYTEIPSSKRESLMKTAFLCFPGVLKRGSRMYDGVLMWCLSTRNVLLYRDAFSAGGRRPVAIPQITPREILLPAVISQAIKDLSTNAEIKLSEIEEIHRRSFQDIDELRMFIFQQIVSNDLVADMYNEAVSQMPNPKPLQAEFVSAIAKLITDSINDKGIFKPSTS